MFNVNGIIHYKLRIIELFRLDLKNLIKTREREEKLKTNRFAVLQSLHSYLPYTHKYKHTNTHNYTIFRYDILNLRF